MLAKGKGEWGPRELTNSNITELSVYPLNKPILKPFKKLCILYIMLLMFFSSRLPGPAHIRTPHLDHHSLVHGSPQSSLLSARLTSIQSRHNRETPAHLNLDTIERLQDYRK